MSENLSFNLHKSIVKYLKNISILIFFDTGGGRQNPLIIPVYITSTFCSAFDDDIIETCVPEAMTVTSDFTKVNLSWIIIF